MQPDRPSTPPGFACPPGAEPGGNWVQGSEYASSLDQTPHPKLCTAFQPAHPSWIGRDWNSTPFSAHPAPCFSNPSLHYALSCLPAAAAAHMIRASTQPPVLSSLPPRPTTPDRSVVAGTVQCKPVDWSRGCRKTCRKTHLHCPAAARYTPTLPIFSSSYARPKLTDAGCQHLGHKSNLPLICA